MAAEFAGSPDNGHTCSMRNDGAGSAYYTSKATCPQCTPLSWEERRAQDDETLGPCGCTDYHMSDCPTRTGYADAMSATEWGNDIDRFYDREDW